MYEEALSSALADLLRLRPGMARQLLCRRTNLVTPISKIISVQHGITHSFHTRKICLHFDDVCKMRSGRFAAGFVAACTTRAPARLRRTHSRRWHVACGSEAMSSPTRGGDFEKQHRFDVPQSRYGLAASARMLFLHGFALRGMRLLRRKRKICLLPLNSISSLPI